METWEWIVLAAAVVVALLLVAAFVRIRRRRSQLGDRVGREYERTAGSEGTAGGERRLRELASEREDLDIRPLSPAARDRYLEEWHQAELRFVSDPRDATRAAERLVLRVLEERGYP